MSRSKSVTARRVAAAVLAAGTLVGAATVSASADNGGRSHRQSVEISDVQYDSPGRERRSNHSLNGEWVDVTNTSRRTVNLDGWTLSDEDGNRYTFRDYRLEGRATVRVHTGRGRDTDTDLYQDRRNQVWDDYSDTATLSDDRRRVVDTASWGGRHDRDGRDRHERGHDGRGGYHGRH
ncbi:lamin tail domain-containing protein [Streptomyces sp. NPDC048275]|uniref:lamin tail domain-containing protein n=1 Tax=Streptomyces sp. NPDC048275 TaxID=3155629 RepID=UPI00340A815C